MSVGQDDTAALVGYLCQALDWLDAIEAGIGPQGLAAYLPPGCPGRGPMHALLRARAGGAVGLRTTHPDDDLCPGSGRGQGICTMDPAGRFRVECPICQHMVPWNPQAVVMAHDRHGHVR